MNSKPTNMFYSDVGSDTVMSFTSFVSFNECVYFFFLFICVRMFLKKENLTHHECLKKKSLSKM